MAAVQQRAPVSAPAFVRLLARLGDIGAPSAGPALSEQLGQWIDWNRAIALSRALDAAAAPGSLPIQAEGEAAACARVRTTLQTAITRTDKPAHPTGEDFAPFRRHCVDLQRSMLASTGQLRGRLRDALATGSSDQARLAEVDAVMEMTLSPREHALLATTPTLLGQHFERLKRANAEAPDDAWLPSFRRDLQDVLLAELDVRFHPIEALLAALRTSHASGTP